MTAQGLRTDTRERDALDERTILEIVEEAAHLLPEQAPLHAFVHHNTLHAFEHMHFRDAVVDAGRVLGTEPFQGEPAFAEHLRAGRITSEDIAAVVAATTNGEDRTLFASSMRQSDFRRCRLETHFQVPRGASLAFALAECRTTERFDSTVSARRRAELLGAGPEAATLTALWSNLERAAPATVIPPRRSPRPRDDILLLTSIDSDELIHPLLIRLCAAFLDQGVAYWSMPERSAGFLVAVRRLYRLPFAAPDRYRRGLAEEFRHQDDANWTAEQTVRWALSELGIASGDRALFVQATLLALRGWAGMMRHLEVRPDRAPVEAPPASLMDFLAVRLVMEVVTARNLLREYLGASATFEELRDCARHPIEPLHPSTGPNLELVYEAFVVAQNLPVDLSLFAELRHARALLDEVEAFDEFERRWLLHLAYERHHRQEVLDGIIAHCRLPAIDSPQPRFQAVFCIDDREESIRRHVEEHFPAVETYGYAGFFGVAIEYQGLDDVRPRPLCPVSATPSHLLVEAAEDGDDLAYRRARRTKGMLTHSFSVASKTMARGGLVSGVLGIIAVIPLVLRSLFPRLAAASAHAIEARLVKRPTTRLMLERDGDVESAPKVGYSIPEMTSIVADALRTMGLVDEFSPLVLVVGHGSSSLNNPHEAAHDCGATGGGRGGPNARAFAAMANHPTVRQQLTERGLNIPESTWFVGAYHNTCDDRMTYYDEDLIPTLHRREFEVVKSAMADACALDAHERCRRFETVPARLTMDRAMAVAAIHANDLAEPRPEYGHATNAVCIVGRRERTRGLFLDRRAFLVSYDPSRDPAGSVLTALLMSVGPVGAGINLEYYFSFVDPVGYGSGTKLPHNITGLLGVMDGHATDLRTGLPWQMVEIHEPVRLLVIVEAKQSVLNKILDREPALAGLVERGWIQLVVWDPDSDEMACHDGVRFVAHTTESGSIPVVARSADYYSGRREALPPAHVNPSSIEACK